MKLLILIFNFLIIPNLALASDFEVIELHETKSLDQLVLDQLDSENSQIKDEPILNEDTNENINNDINTEEKIEDINVSDASSVDEKPLEKEDFWNNLSDETVKGYLNNSKNLKSKVLINELSNFLEVLNLDFSLKKNREIYFQIVNYFYDTGNISKAYNLIQLRNVQDDENSDFYENLKINYLLSTFQLEEVCNLKSELDPNIKLNNFLLEKIDIFCLVLENNLSEAELLNSILIETETNTDQNFQNLFKILIADDNELNKNWLDLNNEVNFDLIFLYSAIARIAELPLNENFLQIDSKNLAIPIILNQSIPIDLRIKAANESFNNKLITVDSLAALYQSVDFNSSQLNNQTDTIEMFSDNIEMLMAYYFQLINIQIFPSERIEALISFWDFSKDHDLEEIAYSLSYKIVQSIELSSSNIEYSPMIATSYIYNNDFDEALKWIEFYENNNGIDEKSSYTRILLNLYSANEIETVLDIINTNFDMISISNIRENEELVFTLLTILNDEVNKELTIDFENIYDTRLMPSIFVIQNINQAIQSNNNSKFLIYSVISLNNKDWIEIHPEHLKLLLRGYSKYNDGDLIKDIVLEIFENYKIL